MGDKYVFKLMEKTDEVLLIIQNDNLKFMTEINEKTFNLPYLKNKDLTKFLSKVIDKFQDKTLKLDYTVSITDSNNLLFKIVVWDGQKHVYDINLKSKEIRDAEIIDTKINDTASNLKKDISNDLLKLDRKYDDELDKLTENVDEKLKDFKKSMMSKYTSDNYRNYKFKSFKIIKCVNKAYRSFDIFEESDKDAFVQPNEQFFSSTYNDLRKFEHFNTFIRNTFNETYANDIAKKIFHVKKYFMEISIYNVLEVVLNNYGIIDIVYLNLDFNKATYKVSLDIKFIYDDSEARVYRCYPSLFKTSINDAKLIHKFVNSKKDSLDIFIFQCLK